MKKYLIYLMMAATIVTFGACSPEDENEPQTPDIENPEKPDDEGEDMPDDPNQPGDNPDTPGGQQQNTSRLFQLGRHDAAHGAEIVRQTGADLFRIEPVVPYPTRIYSLHRGSTRREKQQRPSGDCRNGGKLGGLRYGIHRLSRMVVDYTDDYLHLCRKLRFRGKDRRPVLYLRIRPIVTRRWHASWS